MSGGCRFSSEALEEAHPTAQVPPFAIVSSREMDTSVGRYWPVRARGQLMAHAAPTWVLLTE